MNDILINGGMALLILEGIKWLLRLFVFKNPNYDFPPNFYKVAIPVLNILVIPLLALLGVQEVVMPTDWLGWVRGAVLVAVSSLVQVLFYNGGVKRLKEYNAEYALKKEE
jgi:hypothetical protein